MAIWILISAIDIKNQIVQPVLAELTWPTVYILVPVKMCNLSVYKFQALQFDASENQAMRMNIRSKVYYCPVAQLVVTCVFSAQVCLSYKTEFKLSKQVRREWIKLNYGNGRQQVEIEWSGPHPSCKYYNKEPHYMSAVMAYNRL